MDFLTGILGGSMDQSNTWLVVVGAIIITIIPIIPTLRQGKRLKRIEHKANTAAEQTANSHTTNLRDDIDLVAKQVQKIASSQIENHSEIIDRLSSHEQRLNNLDGRINNIAEHVTAQRKGR